MKSSLVVRASDCQCTSCNGPGFDPSIHWHRGIWGAADEAVLNIVRKNPPPPQTCLPLDLKEEQQIQLGKLDPDSEFRLCGFHYSAGIIRQRSIFTKRWGPEAFFGVCKLPLEAWDKDMVENKNCWSEKTMFRTWFCIFLATWSWQCYNIKETLKPEISHKKLNYTPCYNFFQFFPKSSKFSPSFVSSSNSYNICPIVQQSFLPSGGASR